MSSWRTQGGRVLLRIVAYRRDGDLFRSCEEPARQRSLVGYPAVPAVPSRSDRDPSTAAEANRQERFRGRAIMRIARTRERRVQRPFRRVTPLASSSRPKPVPHCPLPRSAIRRGEGATDTRSAGRPVSGASGRGRSAVRAVPLSPCPPPSGHRSQRRSSSTSKAHPVSRCPQQRARGGRRTPDGRRSIRRIVRACALQTSASAVPSFTRHRPRSPAIAALPWGSRSIEASCRRRCDPWPLEGGERS